MNGEGNIVPFLEETLAEKKEQSMMCQHLFQYLVELALDFGSGLLMLVSVGIKKFFWFIFVIEGQE